MRLGVRVGTLGVLALLALWLYQLWRVQPVNFSDLDATVFAAAAVLSFVAVVSYGAVWPLILRRIGAPVPGDSLRLFLQSQLGKYLPGSVWHYAGRVGLARARGVPVRLALVSLGVEVAASAVAAVLVGLFVLPIALSVPFAIAVATLLAVMSLASGARALGLFAPVTWVAVRVVRIPAAEIAPTLRAVPAMAALYIPVWALYGVAFWLTGRALFPIPPSELVFFTAAFALGWLAGMVVVFAPGGVGVREAVLVGLLAPRIGHTEAIVIAGSSRILLTTADLAGGAGALALSRLEQRTQRSLPTRVENGRARRS